MQLESHATPLQESPQQRYARLHRAIEQGLGRDEIWKELAEVCLELGHTDEAVRCLKRIDGPALHKALESRLARLGLVSAPARVARPASPAAAPAASHAGPAEPAEEELPPLRDHLVDAVQLLFHGQMPWLALVATLAFPLLVGVGGFLTSGGSPWLWAGLAALPGLAVLATVGAMGRRILMQASDGAGEAPRLPEVGELLHEARRCLVDAVLVLGSLVAPSLVALGMGTPLATAGPALLTGAFFTPLAWMLRTVRGDLVAVSPVPLCRAVARTGLRYAALAGAFWALFAPATLVAFAVANRPLWVGIAVVGPLVVLPLFVAARLCGTWLDAMRPRLGGLLRPRAETRVGKAYAHRTPAVPERRPAAPKARAATPQPAPQRQAAPAARVQGRAPAAPTRPTRPAAPARPAAAARPAAKAPAKAAAPAPAPRAIAGRRPQAAASPAPGLPPMPGATVVAGQDRHRAGAAAARR